jgi:L-erythro-3,5-diaminohexanoate dehydrogenase
VTLLSSVESANGGRRFDLVVNVANVPGTETASVLCARDEGTVLFFGMATSFQAAALGAEGVAHPGTLVIGNGYVPGHAEYALDLLRRNDRLRGAFTELVG